MNIINIRRIAKNVLCRCHIRKERMIFAIEAVLQRITMSEKPPELNALADIVVK